MTSRNTPKHPSILDLSPEIQLSIFQHLAPTSGRSERSIHAVVLTCKQFHSVALPLTVQTFRHNLPGARGGRQQRPDFYPIWEFFRHVSIIRPELARHVRCISVGYLHEPKLAAKHQALSAQDLEHCGRLIEDTTTSAWHNYGADWKSDWLRDLSMQSEEAQLALLLVACPKIEMLLVDESQSMHYVRRVFDVASARGIANSAASTPAPALLGHLREIYTESEEVKYGNLSWHHWLPALRIPSVRSFEVIMANTEGSWARAIRLHAKPRSSNVEEILLRRSCIAAPVMLVLAAIPRALKVFEYTRGICHMYDKEMMPGDMLDALLPHANSLESLHGNFEDHWGKIGDTSKVNMGLNLRKMVALRRLVTGMQALTGMRNQFTEDYANAGVVMPLEVEDAPTMVECLPENLEFLEIHACGIQILPQAQQLLDDCTAEGRFSRLRHIRLLFNVEDVAPEEIKLRHDPTVLRLDIYIQSADNRFYDLISNFENATNACTRIHGEGSRERWLKYRGQNIGFATVNGGVYREPGYSVEPVN